MNTRMDKYDLDDNKTLSRSEKNRDLYKSINSNEVSKFDSYNNVKILDEGAALRALKMGYIKHAMVIRITI